MDLEIIIADLENYSLQVNEMRSASASLVASVIYFFEQVAEKPVWTREELEDLKRSTQLERSLTLLGSQRFFDDTDQEPIGD